VRAGWLCGGAEERSFSISSLPLKKAYADLTAHICRQGRERLFSRLFDFFIRKGKIMLDNLIFVWYY
jgi:hypothetical protein